MVRNCIEAEILRELGGGIIECQGTQRSILKSIVIALGGTVTSEQRNGLLEDVLRAYTS